MEKSSVTALVVAAVIVVSLATGAVLYAQVLDGSQTNSGQFAILATDPPTVSDGVTATSITYSSVQVHDAGSASAGGWTQVSGSGSLDLMSSSTTVRTIASSKVNAGTYDAIRFNIDSAKVTYHGQAYVAAVTSSTVTVQLQDQVRLNSSANSAAVVDLRTVVMNAGDSSSPQFIFNAKAFATALPPSEASSISVSVGSAADFSGRAWFNQFVARTSTKVSLSASITGGSLLLSAQNSGSADAEVQTVIVTPVSGSASVAGTLPTALHGSAVFVASNSGTLQSTDSIQAAALLNSGTTIAANGSTTLSFLGNITLGFGQGGAQITGIVSGQQYLVTVIGANTQASAVVVAA